MIEVMLGAAGGSMLLALGFVIGWRAGRYGVLYVKQARNIAERG